MKVGFDINKYVRLQTNEILDRIKKFDNKLYLEFGGKLFDDYHAARVLPGFDSNVKTKLLIKLRNKAEIIFCIRADDIERNKIRADTGINYGMDVMRLIDSLRSLGILVSSIVITQYSGQVAADVFKNKLERHGEKVYVHTKTKGYPTDVSTIVSDDGYGKNPFIETTRPLVVVTAPGPGSGKLATCLCQLYHESKHGVKAGYAKFETFPIWNIPLKHPVNLAYEAATADLKDVNMIDYFHLEAHGISTVNYNRDLEIFPVVKTILHKITGEDMYSSPTDMGVNMAGLAIKNDEVVQEAARQEIIRRYYKACCDYKLGTGKMETVERIELLLSELGLVPTDRAVVTPALEKAASSGATAVALQLQDGRIVTGRTNEVMTATASVILNAVKTLARINDKIDLIASSVLMPIIQLKTGVLGFRTGLVDAQEALIALSICAATNPTAKIALEKVPCLYGTEAHSTCMLTEADEMILRKLQVNFTSEAVFRSNNLYY